MNKFKIALAGIVALILPVSFMSPARAAEPFIFWHGQDWGKITADRKYAIPRDNECDGNEVYIIVYEDGNPINYRRFDDSNGCKTGGGKYLIPNWANRARLCEYSEGCTPNTPLSEW